MGIAGAGMFGVFLFLTFYLQNTLGFSPIQSGLAFLPMSAAIIATATTATTRLRAAHRPEAAGHDRHGARRDRDGRSSPSSSVDSDLRAAHPPGPADPRRRPRPGLRAGLQRRDPRRRARGRRRRLGDGQHQPAGRRLGRHRAAVSTLAGSAVTSYASARAASARTSWPPPRSTATPPRSGGRRRSSPPARSCRASCCAPERSRPSRRRAPSRSSLTRCSQPVARRAPWLAASRFVS